jgi:hypothetical protein
LNLDFKIKNFVYTKSLFGLSQSFKNWLIQTNLETIKAIFTAWKNAVERKEIEESIPDHAV